MGVDVTFRVWVKHLEADVTFFDVQFPKDGPLINEVLVAVTQTLVRKIDFDPQHDSAGWAVKSVTKDGVPFRPEFVI